jgi:photosystem II stability/assembly factor-like uncharacterized protein
MIRRMALRRAALALLLFLTACNDGTPVARPTPTTPPPASATPTATPSPTKTAKPTKKPPKPTATPTPPKPGNPVASGPAPERFRPLDFSFIGPNVGWALGEECGADKCLARTAWTTNSGKSWHKLPSPVNLRTKEDTGTSVRQMRFGNLKNGYLFDPSLLSTHDGGKTWKKVELPGDVVALNETKGTAWALVRNCGPEFCELTLWVSPMDKDAFAKRATLDLGGKQGATYELIRGGANDGWLSAVGGAGGGGVLMRTTNAGKTWAYLTNPCTGFEDGLQSQQLTRASGVILWLGCSQGAGAGSEDKAMFRSTNGGASWQSRGNAPRSGQMQDLVATSVHSALLATTHSGLLRTTTGGASWNVVAPDCCDAGFGKIETIDNVHAWAIGHGANAIFFTANSGASWGKFAFAK